MYSNFKKLLLFVALSLCVSIHAFSQNEVSGSMRYSTTWTKEMSPIHVTNNFTVYDTVTLTIEPDVEVIFQGNYKMNIDGNLVAEGTKTDSIIFTKSDTVDSWQGINIETADTDNDSSLFKYVKVEYANTYGIYAYNTDKVAIKNSTFTKNSYISVRVMNSDVIIANNTFSNNDLKETDLNNKYSQLTCYGSTVYVLNNLFINNSAYYIGATIATQCDIYFINNTFASNYARAYTGAVNVNNGSSTFINNVFWDNKLGFGQDYGYEKNLYLSGGSHYIKNSAFEDGKNSIYKKATLTYEGGSFDATCIDLDTANIAVNGPNFTNPVDNDYTLSWKSPLINAGDTTDISTLLPAVDLNGASRIQRGKIDIGAYESSDLGIRLIGVAGDNGTVSPHASPVQENGSHTFSIKPNIGYSIDSVIYAGINITENLVASGDSFLYTVNNVTESDTLYATFVINKYLMRATASENGSVTPDSVWVDHGSELVYTISTNEGYFIESAMFGGEDIMDNLVASGDGYTYTVAPVTNTDTLKIVFSIIKFTMTASAGENGTITPTSQEVDYNGSITYTITPDSNYEIETATFNFEDVMDDLVETDGAITYSVANITEAGYLEVSFTAIPVDGLSTLNTENLKIYPNPGTERITVDGCYIQSIEVINMVGHVVELLEVNENKTILDISNYPKGFYLVKVSNPEGSLIEKIVIE